MQAVAHTDTEDHVRTFVEELLRTGIMLSGLLADLLDDLPENAFPGEAPAQVLLEMVTGTIRPAADVAGEIPVRSAAALIASSRARVLGDLRRAVDTSRREPKDCSGSS
jgi:hypothetical protein